MKRLLMILPLLPVGALCILSCNKAAFTGGGGHPATTARQLSAGDSLPGYKLVWSDEFDYTGVPDSTKWNYEVGFVRNQELQYYTKGRPENVYVQNGMLEITGRREDYPNAAYISGSTGWQTKDSLARYTSASMITYNREAFTYGRMEIRAKLPGGSGMWPAFWMMGTNRNTGAGWPRCGEVDIMEYFGKNPAQMTASFHYANASGGHVSPGSGKLTLSPLPYDQFYVYRAEWDRDSIVIYVDNQRLYAMALSAADVNGDNAFRKPFYILMNYALGSTAGTLDTTKLPGKYIIDYVRVYKKSLLGNPGFENATLSPWTTWGGGVSVVSDANVQSGGKALKETGGSTSAEQVVSGLRPNTTYVYGGYAKVSGAGQVAKIGVKNFDGTSTDLRVNISSTSYTAGAVTFTTGPTNTSATVYFFKPDAGTVYGDDLYLYEQ